MLLLTSLVFSRLVNDEIAFNSISKALKVLKALKVKIGLAHFLK
jgi:hypothetical protein